MPVTEEQGNTILDRMAIGDEKYGPICEDLGISEQDAQAWKENHKYKILEAEQYSRILREHGIDPKSNFWVRLMSRGSSKRVKGWANGQPIMVEENK